MTIDTIRATFQGIQDSLAASYVEREAAVEAIVLASLSGQNALLIGPPGTGKSALFLAFLSHFSDARTFQTLVTKFSTEDSLFGPVKLSALKADRWERALDGKLAAVETAFLDEFFKASDAALNTLLSAVNERTYQGARIPLRLTVAASNELPADDGLAAIYDRFVVREVVEYVQGDDAWADLMSAPPTYAPGALRLSLSDWADAVAAVAAVELPESIVRALVKIRRALRDVGVIASDRRWIALARVLRASAWLDGRAAITMDDFRVLRFGLWTKPEDRVQVKATLDAIDAGPAKSALEWIDDALAAYHARPTDAAALRAARPSLVARLERAAHSVDAIVADGVSKRAGQKIGHRRAELQAAWDDLASGLAASLSPALAGLARRSPKLTA
jgi:MoxR-like ATPase